MLSLLLDLLHRGICLSFSGLSLCTDNLRSTTCLLDLPLSLTLRGCSLTLGILHLSCRSRLNLRDALRTLLHDPLQARLGLMLNHSDRSSCMSCHFYILPQRFIGRHTVVVILHALRLQIRTQNMRRRRMGTSLVPLDIHGHPRVRLRDSRTAEGRATTRASPVR